MYVDQEAAHDDEEDMKISANQQRMEGPDVCLL